MAYRGLANSAVLIGGAGLASVVNQTAMGFDKWMQAGSLAVGAFGLILKAVELWLKYRANKKTR